MVVRSFGTSRSSSELTSCSRQASARCWIQGTGQRRTSEDNCATRNIAHLISAFTSGRNPSRDNWPFILARDGCQSTNGGTPARRRTAPERPAVLQHRGRPPHRQPRPARNSFALVAVDMATAQPQRRIGEDGACRDLACSESGERLLSHDPGTRSDSRPACRRCLSPAREPLGVQVAEAGFQWLGSPGRSSKGRPSDWISQAAAERPP